MKIRVWSRVVRDKELWYCSCKKEILSGPWKSNTDAYEASLEWIV